MSARATIAQATSGHSFSFTGTASGTLSNTGSRTAAGLENIGTATTNTFTLLSSQTIKVKELCNVPINTSAPIAPNDGAETTAGPYIKVKSITIPSSYQGQSLSFSHTASSDKNPTNFMIFPDVKISVNAGSYTQTGVQGVGEQEAVATITGPVKEMDDWVIPWNDPNLSTPKFDGSDYATTRSAGYVRENPHGTGGIFFVEFVLEFGLLDNWTTTPSPDTKDWPGTPLEQTFKIGIINNSDNDRDVYIQKYEEAYKSLTKVPELDERKS
tara:strand:- start:371 stop:1180 length:810 start_codon:yes stop_codon:yes gene_type:complete